MTEKKTKKKRVLVKDESSDQPIVSANERVDYTKPAPNGKRRPYGGTGEGNPDHAHIPQEDRCKATKRKTGEPCQRLPIKGTTLCYVHGGAAPQIRHAGMVRIQNNAVRLVQSLLDIALDEEQPAPVRIAASRDLLDRGGVRVPDKVDVSHEVKPWEALEAKITRVPSERVSEETEARALDLDDDRY